MSAMLTRVPSTLDFETNKRIVDEVAVIQSKRLRNKVRSLASPTTRRERVG
jgi:small subunit ribosomal protein S17e